MLTEDQIRKFIKRINALNKASPSLCLAKWYQSSINLKAGTTQSCHHCLPDKIDSGALSKDPSLLHNSDQKRKARKQMLIGEQPEECNYCWRIERSSNHYSDRSYKSMQDWAWDSRSEVIDKKNVKVNPTYLEVAFDNKCNFKCVYCSPSASSKWENEVSQFGPIPQAHYNHNDIEELKAATSASIPAGSPYLEAFWKWWPELYPKLRTFRVTGGEPLLSDEFWRVLDWIEDSPRKDLEFAVNTNLGVPSFLVTRLIEKINILNKKIKKIKIYTSYESAGEQCEYIRHGMKFDSFFKNINRVLEESSADFSVMATINILSVPGFVRFIDSIIGLRQRYNISGHPTRIEFMLTYLRHPSALDFRILPRDIKEFYIDQWRNFLKTEGLKSAPPEHKIFPYEEGMFERLFSYFLTIHSDEATCRKDFVRFIDEIDRRRDLSFKRVFPELERFYRLCELQTQIKNIDAQKQE